jgi:hypothetical protein
MDHKAGLGTYDSSLPSSGDINQQAAAPVNN